MKKRHSAEQIVAKLRQPHIELGKGLKVLEVGADFVADADLDGRPPGL